MENRALMESQLGQTSCDDSIMPSGRIGAGEEDPVVAPAVECPVAEDFTSVEWSSSDAEPPTKDQAVQTMAPHLVNEWTQYSDPDDIGSETDTGESTNSSQRPVLFASTGARRRRLWVADWLMPDHAATEDSIQYTGNGHTGGRAEEPENDH